MGGEGIEEKKKRREKRRKEREKKKGEKRHERTVCHTNHTEFNDKKDESFN